MKVEYSSADPTSITWRQVSVDDHSNELSPTIRTANIIKCSSNDWKAIGQKLLRLHLLEQLNIDECDIDSSFYQSIRTSWSLSSISIHNCKITRKSIMAIAGIPQLRKLRLSCSIRGSSESIFSALLQNAHQLQILQLKLPEITQWEQANVPIGTLGARHIVENLSGLTCLIVPNCGINSQTVEILSSGLPYLRELDVSKNQLDLFGALSLSKHAKLEWLYIDANNIQDEGLVALTKFMENLRVLHAENNCTSAEALEILARNLIKLKELWIGNLYDFNVAVLSKSSASRLARNLLQLQFLVMPSFSGTLDCPTIDLTKMKQISIEELSPRASD